MIKFKNLYNSSYPILVEKQSIPDQSAKNYSKKFKKSYEFIKTFRDSMNLRRHKLRTTNLPKPPQNKNLSSKKGSS